MSQVIPFFQTAPADPNLVRITGTGIINLSTGVANPTNGYLLTDLAIEYVNAATVAAALSTYVGAFGYVDTGLTTFVPIQTLTCNFTGIAAGTVNLASILPPLVRQWGDGLICPQGRILAVNTLLLSNITSFTFNLDLTGTFY